MNRQLIILGHSGFLGRCLYEHFSKDPNYKVYGFSSAQFDLSAPKSISALNDLIDNVIDYGALLIMTASVLTKSKDLTSFRKEISMFVNIVDSAFISKIKHIIYISSTAVYGRHSDSLITEASLPNPDDFYSSAKLIGELIFKQVCADRNIGLTILRPGIFYGRGDIRSPLYRFINNVRIFKEIEIYGEKSTRLVWIYKDDLRRIVSSVANECKLGDYNIVSDDGISLSDLAEMAMELCGRKIGVKFIPSHKIPMKIRFDTTKFKTDFPGFKFTNFEDGIKEYNIP